MSRASCSDTFVVGITVCGLMARAARIQPISYRACSSKSRLCIDARDAIQRRSGFPPRAGHAGDLMAACAAIGDEQRDRACRGPGSRCQCPCSVLGAAPQPIAAITATTITSAVKCEDPIAVMGPHTEPRNTLKWRRFSGNDGLPRLPQPTNVSPAQAFQKKAWNQIDADRISDQTFTETTRRQEICDEPQNHGGSVHTWA